MTPERWLEIRRVFGSVLELTLDERLAVLERECALDPLLRREVEILLAAHGSSPPDFLVSPPLGAGPDAGPDEGPLSVLPQQLGPWHVERKLGHGAMGTVYLAVMTEDRPWARAGERVALKVLHPGLHVEPGARERLAREGQVGRLVEHASVARAHALESVESEGTTHVVLVQELVVGQTLREVMRELGTVPEPLVRHLALQVARGVQAIHAARVVHRDLKPENIMITSENEVKILDLGIARLLDPVAPLTGAQAFIGSSRHAAPEQFEHSDVGPAADLYSLGVVLYEAATGVNPFDGQGLRNIMRLHAEKIPALAGSVRPEISSFLEQVLRQLLEKDPSQRFASASALAQVLEEGEESAWWQERAEELRRSMVIRRPRIARDTAFVGRGHELELLSGAWREARAGQGALILLEGEAGVGKSRLVEELCDVVARGAEPALVLESKFGGAGDALAAALLGQLDASDLEGDLARLLPATRLLVPAMAAHLRGLSPPADAPPLTQQARQTLYCRLAQSFAASRAMLWVFEDLHLATPEELVLLQSLARIAEGARLLLVATTREGLSPQDLAALEAIPRARRVALGRLSAREVILLVAETLHSERLGELVGGRVAFSSDGNAFFAVEMLRELQRTGLVDALRDGSTSAGRAFAAMEVPSTVRGLITHRLEKLAEADRIILDVASVQGFEFDAGLVAHMLERSRLSVLQSIARLERRTRLVRSSGAGFAFDHHLLREVIHEALPPPLRAEYHGILADAFVEMRGLDASKPAEMELEHAAFLTEHWLRGSKPERAEALLLHVLDGLASRERDGAVSDLVDLALSRLEADAARRCDLCLRQAMALLRIGADTEARAAAQNAVAASDDAADSARGSHAHLALARSFESSDTEAAMREAREALRLARIAGKWQREAQAMTTLGNILAARLHLREAREHFEQVLAIALARADRSTEAVVLGNLGMVSLIEGNHVEGEQFLSQAIDIADSLQVTYLRWPSVANQGISFRRTGRAQDASRCFEECLAHFLETGNRSDQAAAVINLASVSFDCGRIDEARSLLERGLVLSREAGNVMWECNAESLLGEAARAEGELADARLHREASLALAHRLGGVSAVEARELRQLARVAADEGSLLEAMRLAEEADGRFGEGASAENDSCRLRLLAEIDRGGGENERALDTYLRLREQGRSQSPIWMASILVPIGSLLVELGDRDTARQHFLEAEGITRNFDGQLIGDLPAAWLALMGERDARSVDAASIADVHHRAEAHLVLHRAGAGGAHLAEARTIMERMSRHLSGPALEQFWRNNPTARGILEAEARG